MHYKNNHPKIYETQKKNNYLRSNLLLLNEVCNNYFSPVGLFYGVFRLTDFLSDDFDFSSSKKKNKQVALSGHYVLLDLNFAVKENQQ